MKLTGQVHTVDKRTGRTLRTDAITGNTITAAGRAKILAAMFGSSDRWTAGNANLYVTGSGGTAKNIGQPPAAIPGDHDAAQGVASGSGVLWRWADTSGDAYTTATGAFGPNTDGSGPWMTGAVAVAKMAGQNLIFEWTLTISADGGDSAGRTAVGNMLVGVQASTPKIEVGGIKAFIGFDNPEGGGGGVPTTPAVVLATLTGTPDDMGRFAAEATYMNEGADAARVWTVGIFLGNPEATTGPTLFGVTIPGGRLVQPATSFTQQVNVQIDTSTQ